VEGKGKLLKNFFFPRTRSGESHSEVMDLSRLCGSGNHCLASLLLFE